MNRLRTALLTTLMLVGLIVPAVAYTAAVEVFYDLQPYGSGWKYSYIVKNNSLTDYPRSDGVSWFNTYFPATQDIGGHYLYSNINNTGITQPAGWQSAGILQPDVNRLPIHGSPLGLWGALISAAGGWRPIEPGESLGGFNVRFNYAGTGTPPGQQQFEILDVESGNLLFAGTTQPIAAVPIPPSIFLLGAGLFGLAALKKKS